MGMPSLRAILSLSRPGGLPTVWSNCLAGWWLGGGHRLEGLPWIFAGATLLYLGAAFLNDAFDVVHDRQWRRARPIPAGGIGLKTAWRWGLALLVAGAFVLWGAGPVAGGLGLTLVALIVLYNLTRHALPFRPLLSGVCRWALYALGASVAARGVTGWALWCGLAAALYMAGAGFFAEDKERSEPRYWPAALLAAPILLALILNTNEYREPALLLSAVLGIWLLRCFRYLLWRLDRNPASALEGMAAGLVFVDWLAACPVLPGQQSYFEGPRELSFIFLALFGISLALHRAFREPPQNPVSAKKV